MKTQNRRQWLIEVLGFVSIVGLFLFLATKTLLVDPVIWPDEPVFFSVAKSINQSGTVATSIYGHLLSTEPATYDHPPVYFLLLSGWLTLFGEEITTLRLFSVFMGASVLVGLWFLLKEFSFQVKWILIGLLITVISDPFLRASRILRMEIVTLFFIILACIFFLKFLKKTTNKNLFLSGSFSMLAVLTHPMGILILGINGLALIVQKMTLKDKTKAFGLLFPPSIIGIGIWLFSIRNSLGPFFEQYQLQVTRRLETYPYVFTLFQTDPLYRIFLIFILLLFCSYLFLMKGKMDRIQKYFLLATIVAGLLVILSKEMWYLVYFLPFLIILNITVFKNAFKTKNLILKSIFVVISVIPFITQLILITNSISLNIGKNYYSFAEKVAAEIPNNTNVCLSSIPDPYFELRKNHTLRLYEFLYLAKEDKSLDEKKIQYLRNCDYVVINYPVDALTENYIYKNTKTLKQLKNESYGTILVELKEKSSRH